MSDEELKGKQIKSDVQKTTEEAVTEVKEVKQSTPETTPQQVTEVTEKAKTTVQQGTEAPETAALQNRAQQAASTSGQVVGAGLKKVANVLDQFTSGVSKGMDAGQPPKQVEERVQQTQETQGAPKSAVIKEEEKIKKKEVKQY